MTNDRETQRRIAEVLRASRLFAALDAEVLGDLAARLELVTLAGGSVIFREGDVADSMLIVVSGRLRVSRRDADGQLLLYNEIAAGECVGETGMILHQARTADVTALRDSTLGFLRHEAYEELLKRHPLAINRVFSQAIYDQLRHAPQHLRRPRAESFVLLPLHAGVDVEEVVDGMRRSFAARGTVGRLMVEGGNGAGDLRRAIDRYEELEKSVDAILIVADGGDAAAMRQAFRQADQVVFVAAADAAPARTAIEAELAGEPGFALKRQHLVVLHPASATMPASTQDWRMERMVERVYPIRAGRDEDYDRLGRFLTGSAIGLVLGGGGARGFAHLGVLRAFEEAGVPIDLIGGNSMGALIGAQYALGASLDDIARKTLWFAQGGEHPTLPVISLLSGKRLARDLQVLFGEARIDRLWRPYFAAACNLTRACTTVQDSGLIWRAVLASNSPAGLLPPVPHRGELLVDGAILDNVPVAAMRARLGTPLEKRHGNGTVVAIDVDVQDDLSVAPEAQRLSAWTQVKGYLRRDEQVQPGIGDILYRAGHIGGLHQRDRTKAMADIYLQPPVSEFALMAYRQAPDIVEAGYRYALQEIAQWQHLRRSSP